MSTIGGILQKESKHWVGQQSSNCTHASQMWYLFKVMSFILILGTTHGAFRSRRSVNPEANMNISQIISYWGYPGEVHDVVTEDGYILGLYRIPYGKANNDNSAQKLVVYLQHGLLTSGSSWVSNLLINSLGFILADAGYDVWLGNSRGTTWSRKHLYLKTNSKEFWAFSFDEMAKYDLPASIDFIVKHTGQKEIFYVGHSQGTTIAFITFSTIPKIAEKVKIFFALAPVFSIKYSNSPLIKMAYKWKSVIKSRMDVYMSHNPAGTSVQNMLHWSQLFNSSRLRAFDWGSPVLNWMHFNQTTSPFYNVTCMNVSTSTWNGARDVLADPQDINNLLSEITNHIYHKTISSYNHIDFLFGLDVYHQVYREIIDIIQGTL
ncbi:lipase member J isoform X5 [Panthera tigris]|uniref:lipase member J isoform X5 n=1 Tax=Panthera tigris TaxID=9694 RepID=UPI001C6F7BDE|nr:lipase member J isoform X5 [Panthera tigris]